MSDNYAARVVKPFYTPHPDPETTKIKVASITGVQYIVGVNENDELMLLFPAGCQVSEEVAKANNLLRDDGGMLEVNRKVKPIKLRGCRSEGLLLPLSALSFAGDVTILKEGDVINEFNGVPVAKRFTPKHYKEPRPGQPKKVKEVPLFFEHFDTDNLRHNLYTIRNGDLLTVTLKMHGTSHRTALLEVEDTQVIDVKPSKWKFWKKPSTHTITTSSWKLVTGSRRVVIDADSNKERASWYGTDDFRLEATNRISHAVAKNEIWYGEIVGYLPGTSTPIMSTVSTKPNGKDFEKRWGKTMTYKYGCPEGTMDLYIYRIAVVNPDGNVYDLPWNMVKHRCLMAGVKHVPEIPKSALYMPHTSESQMIAGNLEKVREKVPVWVSGSDEEALNYIQRVKNAPVIKDTYLDLLKWLERFIDGPDPIDSSHIREGIVVRVDSVDGSTKFLKLKSFSFLSMEMSQPDDTIDIEEEQSIVE